MARAKSNTNYTAPLRQHTIELVAKNGRVDDLDLADAAGVSLKAARTFLTILSKRRYLRSVAPRGRLYRPTSAWLEYVELKPKTRPTGPVLD